MLRLCELTDVSEPGMMPVEMLSQVDVCGYEERSLGYNRVTLLAEERLATAVKYPKALVKVTAAA